jgi:hypothetical protein
MKLFRKGDPARGANMVEFAIVMPIILLVVIGILETGVAFRDFLTVSNAAKEGVRVLAAMGDDPMVDCVALTKTASALTTSVRIQNLISVEIYRADANGNQIMVDTNRYTLDIGGDPADCDDWTATVYGWDPLDRIVEVGGSPPLDIAGMRIMYTHRWITGFPPFSGSFTINEATISRLEPEEYS